MPGLLDGPWPADAVRHLPMNWHCAIHPASPAAQVAVLAVTTLIVTALAVRQLQRAG
ncbi:MAG TPA: hypothetical protein VKB88_28165 [Bryobacteraceae bacterium]|nr:hypothetical protein [Bryobacteraceae bacterium]